MTATVYRGPMTSSPRTHAVGRWRLARVAVALACMSIGCAEERPEDAARSPEVAAASTRPASAPPVPATPVAAPPVAAPSVAAPPVAAPPLTALPRSVVPVHGRTYWAVYFAVAPMGAGAFRAAQQRARALGLDALVRDPDCDVPGGGDPSRSDAYLVASYFASEADAREIAEAHGAPRPTVRRVETMCLD